MGRTTALESRISVLEERMKEVERLAERVRRVELLESSQRPGEED